MRDVVARYVSLNLSVYGLGSLAAVSKEFGLPYVALVNSAVEMNT